MYASGSGCRWKAEILVGGGITCFVFIKLAPSKLCV